MPESQRRKKTEEIARIKDNGEGMKEDNVKKERNRTDTKKTEILRFHEKVENIQIRQQWLERWKLELEKEQQCGKE